MMIIIIIIEAKVRQTNNKSNGRPIRVFQLAIQRIAKEQDNLLHFEHFTKLLETRERKRKKLLVYIFFSHLQFTFYRTKMKRKRKRKKRVEQISIGNLL